MTTKPLICVSGLTVGYDGAPLFENISFDINRGDIFIIMGPSGCGKSTLLRTMTGLLVPRVGRIVFDGHDFIHSDAATRRKIMRNVGVSFQGGALFSSMTVGENVALPLRQYTNFSDSVIDDIVAEKLALVGLNGAFDLYPAQLSGGIRKRAGLARALALDPEIVFFDEPSAGLDPISSRQLDDFIMDINRCTGTTIIMVTHELESIFAIGTNSIFLDCATHGIAGRGNPHDLLKNPPNEMIRQFLTRKRNIK